MPPRLYFENSQVQKAICTMTHLKQHQKNSLSMWTPPGTCSIQTSPHPGMRISAGSCSSTRFICALRDCRDNWVGTAAIHPERREATSLPFSVQVRTPERACLHHHGDRTAYRSKYNTEFQIRGMDLAFERPNIMVDKNPIPFPWTFSLKIN